MREWLFNLNTIYLFERVCLVVQPGVVPGDITRPPQGLGYGAKPYYGVPSHIKQQVGEELPQLSLKT